MINDVVLEGIVVRDPWKFMDDLFFRLVIYRDSDLPAKKLDLEHDAGDYHQRPFERRCQWLDPDPARHALAGAWFPAVPGFPGKPGRIY